MEKTAMQHFLEWYNDYVNKNGCSPSDYDVNYFCKNLFLVIEKNQILDTGRFFFHEMGKLTPEQYYNETYKQD
jgi:hypothetical protein